MVVRVLVNLLVFGAAMGWLYRQRQRGASVSGTVLVSVVLGAILGGALQAVYGFGTPVVASTMQWVDVVGGIYVRLMQMVVAPLVLVSVTSAVTRLSDTRSLGRISIGVIGLLILTTAASAGIGIGVTRAFGLRADGLVRGAREIEKGTSMQAKVGEATALNVPSLLQNAVPTNVVADLGGTRSTSIMGVVVFATMLGLAALALRRETPEIGERIIRGLETFQALILRLVRMVIRLTPWGVLALMVKVVATSNLTDIMNLGGFVVASYVGLGVILVMHAAILTVAGLSPVRVYQRIWSVLTFAFTSRSSAAAIPLSVEAQVTRLGIAPAIANFAASFGATVGQNGCAGLYPAMLAIMIAPGAGVDVTSPSFLLSVVASCAIGSIGIAGVGGGATFASLVVLSSLNLPVALAGLLISVEPLIDMGRTAINVSGSIVAGTVTSRVLGQTDMRVYDAALVPAADAQGAGDTPGTSLPA